MFLNVIVFCVLPYLLVLWLYKFNKWLVNVKQMVKSGGAMIQSKKSVIAGITLLLCDNLKCDININNFNEESQGQRVLIFQWGARCEYRFNSNNN